MEKITVQQAAEKWGVTPRRVQDLCRRGEIKGAILWHRSWMIPEDAVYPRCTTQDIDQPLPRKTPFLHMTDLYRTPGSAEASIDQLSYNHEAQVLLSAEIAYSRGDIEKVYQNAKYLLAKHSGFYAVLSGGMLLALCAIWRGDLDLWRQAKIHIFEAPAQNDTDRDIVSFTIAAVDCMLYDVNSFPEWFKIGNFELLPPDALPAAKIYYAKYLYTAAYALATKQIEVPGVEGLALMAMLPYTIEPMISQACADNSIICEIYLRMICAVVYHTIGDDTQAVRHIDRAIDLALPDRLYGILAEYCRLLGSMLEKRVCRVDPQAWETIKSLYKTYSTGWSFLSGSVRGRRIVTTLSLKEREVAKLAAFGMSNPEIAEKLHMSLPAVKQAIRITAEKSGVSRGEFATIL
ncbi:MAG: helix-turn-helix domain-containing protein [Clostridia bacterium]|nr:helix-turn-helix domain-containing protein [Clostridia bacterium]